MYGKTALRIMTSLKGERVAGSKEEKAAIKAMGAFCRERGLKPVTYKCPLFVSKPGKGIIRSGNTVIEGNPYSLSVPFNAKGRLLVINSAAKLDNVSNDIHNCILLMRERPAPKPYAELKKRGLKGIITATRTDGRMNSLHLTQKNYIEGNSIPFIDIAYDDAVKLMNLEGSTIEIKGAGKTLKAEASNLYCDIKGTHSAETIAVMGHIDSVPFSPGAGDNSGGIGIMCELIERFAKHPVKRKIRFMFFSAEEWGLPGSKAYAARNKTDNVITGLNILNIDVAGDKLGLDRCIVTGNDKLLDLMNTLNKYHGFGFTCTKDIYSSDNMPFSDKGIPTVNMFRGGGKPSAFVHTKDDSVEHASHEGLSEIVRFAEAFIEMAGNAEQNIIDKTIDDTVREKIENYFKRAGGR